MPIFAPEFGGAAQEEGQQRPIFTGVELAQRIFHAVKGDELRPRTKLCPAAKNRALPIALECFIRTTNCKKPLRKFGHSLSVSFQHALNASASQRKNEAYGVVQSLGVFNPYQPNCDTGLRITEYSQTSAQQGEKRGLWIPRAHPCVWTIAVSIICIEEKLHLLARLLKTSQ